MVSSYMSESRFQERYEDFKSALARLEEGLSIETNDSIIFDGVIQRFEFTFELSWKVLKDYLEYKGIHVKTPRDSIKKAFETEIISDGDSWIDMMIDRNKTSHIYDETEARAIYKKIKDYHIHLLRELREKLESMT